MSGEFHNVVEDIQETPTNSDLDVLSLDSKTPLACEECKIKVTSLKILQRHLEGRKHKIRVERKGKCFSCEICEIVANSQTQLNIHLNSSKHKAKVLRKEYNEFTMISTNAKGLWIIIFCVICIFVNLLLLFKMVV